MSSEATTPLGCGLLHCPGEAFPPQCSQVLFEGYKCARGLGEGMTSSHLQPVGFHSSSCPWHCGVGSQCLDPSYREHLTGLECTWAPPWPGPSDLGDPAPPCLFPAVVLCNKSCNLSTPCSVLWYHRAGPYPCSSFCVNISSMLPPSAQV